MTSDRHWLLLRGWSRQAAHWGPFLTHFKKEFPTSEVLTLDLPGIGSASDEDPPLSIHDTMLSVRQRFLSPSRKKVCLLGHSLGGMLTLDWLAHYPDEVERVVLINTSAGGIMPLQQRLRPMALYKIGRAIFSASDKQREEAILQLASRDASKQSAVLQLWLQLAKERPTHYLTALKQLVAAFRFHLPDIKSTVPILLLASYGDELVDPKSSEILVTKWPAASLHIHPWSGHEITLDAPDWVTDRIKAWL